MRGKVRGYLRCLGRPKDHPRVCGEKHLCAPHSIAFLGSPPRMRGKVQAVCYEVREHGITPAYAGKRAPALCRPPCRKDHPRMCGEKGLFCRPPAHVMGSPPHVRGKEQRVAGSTDRARITPACAGKSASDFFFMSRAQGSPPHVRGKDGRAVALAHGNRITPACAGKRAPHPAGRLQG